MRNRAYRRYVRNKAIIRKDRILKELGFKNPIFNPYGLKKYELSATEKGKLAKGKIHCSCWMCSAKSNTSPSVQELKSNINLKEWV